MLLDAVWRQLFIDWGTAAAAAAAAAATLFTFVTQKLSEESKLFHIGLFVRGFYGISLE